MGVSYYLNMHITRAELLLGKENGSGWFSQIQAGAKYGNVNSGSMTIYNVQTNDGGRYRCGDYYNLEQIDVSVRGMYSR